MKTVFIVLCHYSRVFRPFGLRTIKDFVVTLKAATGIDYDLLLIDNESEGTGIKELALSLPNTAYLRIDDQIKLGITGAWNLGIQKAVELGYEIIIVANDDIKFNSSIKDFIAAIEQDEDNAITSYGPLTDDPCYPKQHATQKQDTGFIELHGVDWQDTLYGFFFAFTNQFYQRFKQPNGDLFLTEHKYAFDDAKWGGQEGMFRTWQEQGAKQKVFTGCWLEHVGCQSWKTVQFADQQLAANVNLLDLLKKSPEQASVLRNTMFKHSRRHLADV